MGRRLGVTAALPLPHFTRLRASALPLAGRLAPMMSFGHDKAPPRRTTMINWPMHGISAVIATTAWLAATLALLPSATASAAGAVPRSAMW